MPIEEKIKALAAEYAEKLENKISERVVEMEIDDKSHYLVYRVLGISSEEGQVIDAYQNKGRFLYRYAGAFLENATVLCFREKYPDANPTRIPNTISQSPKNFQIDCLIGTDAIEVKWRDATTDGDHRRKELHRIEATKEFGYKPIRVMFFYPNREQAMAIQKHLEEDYARLGGEYYHGDAAWQYVEQRTGIDLKAILEKIAKENNDGS